MASPFGLAWLNGRITRSQAQAKAAETAQDRLDRLGREQYEALRGERDHAQARLRELEQRFEELERDRDDGWDAGRGMEEWGHNQRHDFCGLVHRHNTLLALFGQLAAGELAPERAAVIRSQLQQAADPARVPLLRDVERKRP